MNVVLQAAATGIGATLIMDIWAIVQKRLFNIPSLDYRLVARWVGHMSGGHFFHNTILQARPVNGEVITGWLLHYLTGILFAIMMITVTGSEWLIQPALFPALATGIISVMLPFFIMQPGFGFGIAAAKTPHPWVARKRSLIAHTSYGAGLYMSAQILRLIMQ